MQTHNDNNLQPNGPNIPQIGMNTNCAASNRLSSLQSHNDDNCEPNDTNIRKIGTNTRCNLQPPVDFQLFPHIIRSTDIHYPINIQLPPRRTIKLNNIMLAVKMMTFIRKKCCYQVRTSSKKAASQKAFLLTNGRGRALQVISRRESS